MTWLNFSKLTYGTLDRLDNRNGKPEVEYREIAHRLTTVELPYTLRFRIEPQTLAAVAKSRKNLMQWFWRHFGPHYAESRIVNENGVLWLEVWRGKKWYEPFAGLQKNGAVRCRRKKVKDVS